MAKRYTIVANLDTSRIDTGHKRTVTVLEKVERAALKMAVTQEKAWDRAAKAAESASARILAAQARVVSMTAGPRGTATTNGAAGPRRSPGLDPESTRQTKAALADVERLRRQSDRDMAKMSVENELFVAKQKTATAAEASKATVKDTRLTADQKAAIEESYLQKDYTRRVAYEARKQRAGEATARRAVKDGERATTQLDRIQDRYLKRDYERTVSMERRKAGEVERIATASYSAITTAGVAVVATVGASLVEIYHKIEAEARKATDAVHEARKSLRIEATLMGERGPNNEQLLRSSKFRVETGLGATEASDFFRQYEGSVNIGLQKNMLTQGKEGIARKVADELRTQAGIRAARIGGDTGTQGELAGLLGQFGPIESAKQGLGQLESIRQALTEGRGDDTPLTRQLLKSAGAMVKEGGAVGTLEEQAAFIGATSLSAGTEASGERLEQLNRGLRGGLTKFRKGKGALDSQAGYLAKVGVTEKMSLEDMLDQVVPDIKRAEKAGRDPMVYLAEQGFREFQERRALIETANNYDVVKERLKNARKAGKGDDEYTKNQEFLNSSYGVRERSAAATDVTKYAQGLKFERLDALRAAEASMPENRAYENSTMGGVMDKAQQWAGWYTPDEQRQNRLKNRVLNRLREQGVTAGISRNEMRAMGDRPMGGGELSQDKAADFVNKLTAALQARGVLVGPHLDNSTAELKKSIDRLANAFDKSRPQAPPPLPARNPRRGVPAVP